MGRLSTLQIPTTLVETPGGAFAVRGLSLEDLVNLYNEHTDQAGSLFDQFNKWAGGDAEGFPPLAEFTVLLISQAPAIVARIIAKAADDDTPEGVAIARRLTPLVQADALEAVGRLTFRSEADVEKMMGLATRYAKNLIQALLRAVGTEAP